MFQSWDEPGGYEFMLKNRREQVATGRLMPQINEEYGSEGSYPTWAEVLKSPPARAGDNRRRLAWEMTMAGTYQTTGERADIAGFGGWINGRGDPRMTMLIGYGHLKKFFESFDCWKLEPRPDVLAGPTQPVSDAKPPEAGALVLKSEPMVLAEEGQRYVIYLPRGGSATVKLGDGNFGSRWFNPRTGQFTGEPFTAIGEWTSPRAPDADDWVLLVDRRR